MPEKVRDSFALFDAGLRLIDWNDGFEQEFQFAAPMLYVGADYSQILRAAVDNPVARQFMQDQGWFTDADALIEERLRSLGHDSIREYRTADGRVIQVDQQRTRHGGIRRIARDITDERDIGVALTKANQRLDEVDAGLGGVITETRRTPDGNYVYQPIDEPLRRLLDLPVEYVGQDSLMFFARMRASKAEHARNFAQLEMSARTLKSIEQDYHVRDGMDRMRWLRHSMMPRREADGTVVFSGILRDVTREKEAEDQVELLRSVVVHSSDSVAIFETAAAPKRSTKILYVNTKFTELFGGSAESLIGQPMQMLASNDFRQVGYKLLSAAVKRNDSTPFEYQALGKGGRIFWVEVRVNVVQKFEDGGVRWVAISRDVTERRDAQDALLRAKEEAETGNRAKSEFLANMSHELRTPLNAIIGFTELIEHGVSQTGWKPSYAEYLSDVSGSGRHLLDLINTILDLAKIETGQLTLNWQQVDLSELTRAALALVSGMTRDAGIAVSAQFPAVNPPIPGDPLKLKQVLLNILSNAIKFTPQGGTIAITIDYMDSQAVVTITDTGCGIAPKDLDRVTLPFVQVETTLSRKFGGSGLGLSIARQLCDLHGGSLEIASAKGQGTTVRIVLPRSSSPP
jgi:PAS domain S-box-containing protein